MNREILCPFLFVLKLWNTPRKIIKLYTWKNMIINFFYYRKTPYYMYSPLWPIYMHRGMEWNLFKKFVLYFCLASFFFRFWDIYFWIPVMKNVISHSKTGKYIIFSRNKCPENLPRGLAPLHLIHLCK